jgi:hypothetical protein
MSQHAQPVLASIFLKPLVKSSFFRLPSLALLGLTMVMGGVLPVVSQELPQLAQNSVTPLPPGSSAPIEGAVPTNQIDSFRLQPIDGKVKVKVMNTASVEVQYGWLGETKPLLLKPKTDITLELSALPATLTFYPQNKKFIRIRPQVATDPNVLEVTLIETLDPNANRHALVLHKTGLFFTE